MWQNTSYQLTRHSLLAAAAAAECRGPALPTTWGGRLTALARLTGWQFTDLSLVHARGDDPGFRRGVAEGGGSNAVYGYDWIIEDLVM